MLGALNRFGCWPIDLEIPYQYDFISTIGNIAWYCGFLAVVAPLGIYVFIVFFTGSSQGAIRFMYFMQFYL